MSAENTSEDRRARLEQLTGVQRSVAAQRADECYDRTAFPDGSRIVIYGAGGLGRKLLAGLRANGLDALAFSDRNAGLWSSQIEGVPVLSPNDAARDYGTDATFVVAVWHPVMSGGVHRIIADLKSMRCSHVVPFVWLFWKYPDTFLPYFLWDRPEHIIDVADEAREAYGLLAGARSQSEFLRQLEFRLTGDFNCLEPPDPDTQYFPSQLFHPREDECFVDCGAYNGDSLLDLANWTRGPIHRAVAFEADPDNFASLTQTVSADDRLRGRVRAIQQAVGLEKCVLRFAANGLASAALSKSGTIEVECSPLDEAIVEEHPTYIKMDIEGAEMDALVGARNVIVRDRPVLAICAYHTQDHLWQIPKRMHDLMPDARLLLRPYRGNGFDLICYGIPGERECDLSTEDL